MKKFRKNKTLYIAHRGSEASIDVENTKRAFLGAVKYHYDGIETDIQVTKDGKFVCYHNSDMLEHSKSTVEGRVGDYSLEKLKEMVLFDTVGKKEVTGEITTFEEYLDVIKESSLIGIIELKKVKEFYDEPNYILQIIEMIKEKGLLDKVSIISFEYEFLSIIRNHYSDIHLELVYDKFVKKELITKLVKDKINIDLRFDKVNPFIVRCFHKHKLEFNTWTVNFKIIALLFKLFNVDMITTDRLKKSKRLINK